MKITVEVANPLTKGQATEKIKEIEQKIKILYGGVTNERNVTE